VHTEYFGFMDQKKSKSRLLQLQLIHSIHYSPNKESYGPLKFLHFYPGFPSLYSPNKRLLTLHRFSESLCVNFAACRMAIILRITVLYSGLWVDFRNFFRTQLRF
jgi:hypothetical protein